jgi:hypothetical protein
MWHRWLVVCGSISGWWHQWLVAAPVAVASVAGGLVAAPVASVASGLVAAPLARGISGWWQAPVAVASGISG